MIPSPRRRQVIATLAAGLASMAIPARARGARTGRAYMISNAVAGNELLVFERSDAAAPRLVARLATGGTGTAAGLGSQGAVTLAGDGRSLLAVNAGSGSLAGFALGPRGPSLASTVASGGAMPTSVAEWRGLVYVLNAGGAGGLQGFRQQRGVLTPIDGSARPLSAAGGTAPAQVAFAADGRTLFLTERATNLLLAWPVQADGLLREPVALASPGATPFGFAVTRRNRLVVSEAAGGATGASSASSWVVEGGVPRAVSAAVPTTQTAACWVAVTPDGRSAYTANAGSSSVSLFAVAGEGTIALLQAQAAVTGENTGALDMAVAPDGRQLLVFASRAPAVQAYAIGPGGVLSPLGGVGGMPPGSAGLAAD